MKLLLLLSGSLMARVKGYRGTERVRHTWRSQRGISSSHCTVFSSGNVTPVHTCVISVLTVKSDSRLSSTLEAPPTYELESPIGCTENNVIYTIKCVGYGHIN